jgi:hypothetical protein
MKRLMCAAAALAMMLSGGIAFAADVTEHQWVRLSANDSVMGRVVVPRTDGISSARDATVTLINRTGNFATEPVKSDNTGRFTLNGVRPGVYTLMIRGDDLFACCAMHVVSADVPIKETFEIAAGVVDFGVVRNAMVRYMPTTLAADVEFDPGSNPLATERAIGGSTVRVMQVDGGLNGRLTRAGFAKSLGLAEANVIVYRGGVEVGRAVTDDQGNFTVADLEPGSYSVLGSGKYGMGLMGLELVDPRAVQSAARGEGTAGTLVAQVPSVPETFVMQVAPYTGPITVIDDRLVDEEDLGPVLPLGPDAALNPGFAGGAPMGGGGGFGGGGGGGGIGGGGFGRIAMLGGVGAAIAIALADDDDAVETPPVVSPDTPMMTP